MAPSDAPVKLGLFSANISEHSSGPEAVATAQLAEGLGLESLWTGEHIVIPAHFDTPYPYDSSGKMPGAGGVDMPDPLVWLAYVAAATRTIKLATGVTVLPLRDPMVAAKQIATLDVLSGGRFILGIGVGWLAEEFAALGVPFNDRGRRTDAYLEAMRALWTQDEAAVSNSFVAFDGAISRPVRTVSYRSSLVAAPSPRRGAPHGLVTVGFLGPRPLMSCLPG
jgi:probable F420-dependent oxidoreductase